MPLAPLFFSSFFFPSTRHFPLFFWLAAYVWNIVPCLIFPDSLFYVQSRIWLPFLPLFLSIANCTWSITLGVSFFFSPQLLLFVRNLISHFLFFFLSDWIRWFYLAYSFFAFPFALQVFIATPFRLTPFSFLRFQGPLEHAPHANVVTQRLSPPSHL